jgi:hypothetical protein
MQPCHVLGTDHLWALVSPLPGVEADGLWSNPSASGFFGGSAVRFLREPSSKAVTVSNARPLECNKKIVHSQNYQ